MFNPFDWYWARKDGTFYSSDRGEIVQAQDTELKAWLAAGNIATRYPQNDAGDESDNELAAVLAPYGISFGLTDYAAAKRYAIEVGGIMVNGALVDTSRDSQNMINGAYNYAKANPAKVISFKAASGWVTITANQAIAIGSAVGDHVQACFAAEAEIDAAITAGTITTRAQIDAFAWPTAS